VRGGGGGGGGVAATLDAVVVTANKRVENIQDVPKSVAVVTPEALSIAGVSSLRDMGNVVPAIAGLVSSEVRFVAPPIRGITSTALSIGVQAQTGIVIDDIPQPSFSALANELADIERVEVLAGPQSTLSGRNAAGGLINIVTRTPADVFSGELSLEQTDDRQRRITAFMTGPVSGTMAFSLSAFSNEWAGPLRSVTQNRWMSGRDTHGARGKLQWTPNERLTATLSAFWLESRTVNPGLFAFGPYVQVAPGARFRFDTQERSLDEMYAGIRARPYNNRVGQARWGVTKSQDKGGGLRLDYELDNIGTLTSLTSITSSDMPRRDNFLAVPIDGMEIPSPDLFADVDYQTDYKTQELRLTSPGGQKFDYLIGAIWSDTDTWHPYRRLGIFPVNWIRTAGIESLAVFTRGTWNLSARDALTAGLRYQRDKMSYTFGFLPNTLDAAVFDNFSAGNSSYDFFSGEVSWRHALSDDVNMYLTYARTQNGRAYDLEDNNGALEPGGLQPLDSQKVSNIEAGLKGQWLERRLTVNANFFLAKYDDYQIQSTVYDPSDPMATPAVRLYAIGKIETKGLELTSRLRATERLSLDFNAAWLKAEIKDYPNAQCYIRQSAETGCNPATGRQDNLAGQRMPNTPEIRVSGAASYFVPLDALPFDLELGAFYRWQSKTRFDYFGNPLLYENGYAVLNMSATLLDRSNRYSVTLFVNNALDKNFYADLRDDQYWSETALFARYARDSFRYSGVKVQVNF